MLGTIIFLAFGIVMWVVAGVLLYFRRRQLRKTELMQQVQTSNAAEVSGLGPGTLAEVKGTLRCESPLKGEMAEKECAYYLSQVIREYQETRRDSDGDLKTTRRSEVIASNEQFAPFVVEDDTGAVGVRGEGAEVDAYEVMNRFERDTEGVAASPSAASRWDSAGATTPSDTATKRASCRWTSRYTSSAWSGMTVRSAPPRTATRRSGS